MTRRREPDQSHLSQLSCRRRLQTSYPDVLTHRRVQTSYPEVSYPSKLKDDFLFRLMVCGAMSEYNGRM